MKPIDPERTEIALGLRRIDVRTLSINFTFNEAVDLRLTREYWLQTIQPYIKNRKLSGAELYVANDAYGWLRGMADAARRWNQTEAGKKPPIPESAFPDFNKFEFQPPEALLANENLKPETLAGIAATLVKPQKKISLGEAVRAAHELLTAAEEYVEALSLPISKRNQRQTPHAYFEWMYSKITFEEILKSNEKDSGMFPLLPPVQQGRNNGSLTMTALKTAVKKFLKPLPISEEEYEREEDSIRQGIKESREKFGAGFSYVGNDTRLTFQEWQKQNQDSINDFLHNHYISLNILAALRWERFKNFWLKQQDRGKKGKQQKSPNLR